MCAGVVRVGATLLFDPELNHEGERYSPSMGLGDPHDAALPPADWVQTLLDRGAVRDFERFMKVDDPRPEMPLLIAFDSEDLKARPPPPPSNPAMSVGATS